MKISVHALICSNVNPRIYENHKKVYDKFQIPVNYTHQEISQDRARSFPSVQPVWMDSIISSIDSDVFVFLDIDCVPLNRSIFESGLEYAITNNSFIGPSQSSNHIHPAYHIFASPAFFFITKDCHERLGKPSFCETRRSDVAEEVSYVAEEKNETYRCWYPTRYDSIPSCGYPWRLGNYGFFGIGTLFADEIYHLYESRFNQNVELFEKRCNQILNDDFDRSEMRLCR